MGTPLTTRGNPAAMFDRPPNSSSVLQKTALPFLAYSRFWSFTATPHLPSERYLFVFARRAARHERRHVHRRRPRLCRIVRLAKEERIPLAQRPCPRFGVA